MFETRDAIVRAGGVPVAYAVLVNRAQGEIDAKPLFSAYKVEATSYAEDDLPADLAAIPAVKPGTSATK